MKEELLELRLLISELAKEVYKLNMEVFEESDVISVTQEERDAWDGYCQEEDEWEMHEFINGRNPHATPTY